MHLEFEAVDQLKQLKQPKQPKRMPVRITCRVGFMRVSFCGSALSGVSDQKVIQS